ncbi:hypothetical protein LCGC14_3137980, partial [marine sediment metagenome]
MPTGDALLRAFIQSGAKLSRGQITGEVIGRGLSTLATVPERRRTARRIESLIGQADAQAKLAEAQADDVKFKRDFAAASGARQVLATLGTILNNTPEQAPMFLPQVNKALKQYGYPTFDEKDLPKSQAVSVVVMPHIGNLYSTSATTEAEALKTIQTGAAALQQSPEFQGLPPVLQVEAFELYQGHAEKFSTMADRLMVNDKPFSPDQIRANFFEQLKTQYKEDHGGKEMPFDLQIQNHALLQSPGLLAVFGLANDSAKAAGAGGVSFGKATVGGIEMRAKKVSVGRDTTVDL